MNNRFLNALSAAALSLVVVAANVNAQTMMGMTSSHKLVAVGAPTTGSVEISEKGGQTTITLKNLKTEPGPDLHVYLYAGAIPAKTVTKLGAKFVDLGKLGAPFKGNFSYKVPANTDLKGFKSLLIWCDQVKTTFAGANL